MKKLFVLVVIMAMLANPAYCNIGNVQRVFNDDNVSAQKIATSRSIMIKSGGYFGLWVDLDTPTETSGAPKIDIIYQLSYDDTDANYATPVSTSPTFSGLALETPQVITISPTPMKYIRFKAYGTETNTTGTTISAYLFTQE